MDEIDKKTFNNVIDKIKQRDVLQRKFYRNQTDLLRLIEANQELQKQIADLDRRITSMVKPKEVKKDEQMDKQ